MTLTKYPQGSIRECFAISYPLMCASLSLLLMLFVDRVMLANYSIEAFNATINASTLGWAFTFGGLTIATIAEVFVSQYNGSGQFQKLGEPVWQMIWFGLLSTLFFLPLSILGPDLFYGIGQERALEKEYFTWMVFFSPSFAIYGALAAYFIGQGKTHLISIIAFLANGVNLGLDWLMIFGVEGYFPSMGVKGAAIATSLSSLFQVGILFALFLRKKERERSGTSDWRFKIGPFLQCMKIGIPGGCSGVIEIAGWAAFYEMMTHVGKDYITVGGVFESCLILLLFVPEGLNKGVIAICGNLIGSKQFGKIPRVLQSGFCLMTLFFLALLATFPLYVDSVIEFFIVGPFDESLIGTLEITIFLTLIYIYFDGLRYIFSGILTAAGDTLFILIANFSTVWLFLVVPTYFFVVHARVGILPSIFVALLFAFATLLVFFGRYLMGRWIRTQLT